MPKAGIALRWDAIVGVAMAGNGEWGRQGRVEHRQGARQGDAEAQAPSVIVGNALRGDSGCRQQG